MELVLFEEAGQHVCRLARVLARLRGNMLLLGLGGSGKQSLARLAAHLAGKVPAALARKGDAYTETALLDDVKALYLKAGLRHTPLALVLAESQVERAVVAIKPLLSRATTGDSESLKARCL